MEEIPFLQHTRDPHAPGPFQQSFENVQTLEEACSAERYWDVALSLFIHERALGTPPSVGENAVKNAALPPLPTTKTIAIIIRHWMGKRQRPMRMRLALPIPGQRIAGPARYTRQITMRFQWCAEEVGPNQTEAGRNEPLQFLQLDCLAEAASIYWVR